MSIVLQNVAALIWGAKASALPFDFGFPFEIGGIVVPRTYLCIIISALVIAAALHLFLKYTRLGLAVRAVAANNEIAYLMGINVPLMISVIFGAACALAAAAGVLVAPINYIQVLMGIGILIKAFAAAVVGGFGSLPGAILGGTIVGITESLGAGYLSGAYKDIYAFLLLIFVLMVKPSGLFGVDTRMKA
jgi:branched-chain amino acid transport system permease protein